MKLCFIALLLLLAGKPASSQESTSKQAVIVVGHSVLLSWNGVSGVDHYNVYWSGTSGGPYAIVGSTAATNYRDLAVSSGTTYYVVTAVDATGNESVYSNEAKALVPQP